MRYEYAEGFHIRNQSATHYLTFTTEGWIDLFSRKIYKDLMFENFDYCRQKKQLLVHASAGMGHYFSLLYR